jgi:hypothetical protein
MSEDALQTPQALQALQAAAEEYERAAREAELVVYHLRIAAEHFRERDVPRGCAHAFAAYGHLLTTKEVVDHQAIAHAAKSLGPG